MFYPVISIVVTDSLIGGLAYLAVGQIKVLKDNLQHLNEYSDEEIKNRSDKKSILKSRIMYENVFEKTCSLVVFSLFMGVIIRICICCFQLRMFEPLSFNFLVTLSYIAIMLIPPYFYCYYRTALSEESSTLTNSIYSKHWYEYDKRLKNALITLIERAKAPMVVTAGKIMDLSLVTFTTILRRTYSLMTVLNNY